MASGLRVGRLLTRTTNDAFLLALLTRAHRLGSERLLAELGLHVGQERIVFEIGREPGSAQSQLVERMGMGQPTVAKAKALTA